MNDKFENNSLDDISNRLKAAARISKNYNVNKITIDCDELITLCDAAKKLAEYESMEPVAYINLINQEIRKSISEFDENKTIYAAPLYLLRNSKK
ncbi:hypothetical protein FE392_10860 [Xenorhabdus sp. 12]|uniref:Uncharacterized protein n=1 Tax=Xenorhabdus santafensis TaxID=2582833 RepID=A0ABU4SAP8_9GAMM|nr:hypothetical protein [Xenorhabdus sp. 12]MDX7987826.1 hypothetical protein [Xenorhabdus sp. 12]